MSDAEGENLIVGREDEVRKIVRRIQESNKIPTIEGPNGIGKTSTINIALHRVFEESKSDTAMPMFIPCRCPFQIGRGKDLDEFLDEFYLHVALTLIENEDILRAPPGHTKAPIDQNIKTFIESPIIRSFTGSILGNGLGYSATPNTGKGWERVGFRVAIEEWLKLLFPTSDAGAVVCVIDNLEILQSSKVAKEVIEALRDTAFSVSGVKWVLCGSSGVVRGVASSPRMVGWIQKPLNITELSDNVGGCVYDKRIAAFKGTGGTKLPLTQENFITLFDIFNGNVRFTLDEAGSFCTWIFDEYEDLSNIPAAIFETWIQGELETNYDEVFAVFGDTEKDVFRKVCQFELIKLSDAQTLGVEGEAQLQKILEKFVSIGLITPSLDQDEPKDTVYEISPKALKLEYFVASNASD
ncbi:MAG: hypothetical protein QM488_11655 [Rhizobiaceae bacterium]